MTHVHTAILVGSVVRIEFVSSEGFLIGQHGLPGSDLRKAFFCPQFSSTH